MTDRGQIEADAAMARRLQEEEMGHVMEVEWPPEERQRDTEASGRGAASASANANANRGGQDARGETMFPFASGRAEMGTQEMMGELFSRARETGIRGMGGGGGARGGGVPRTADELLRRMFREVVGAGFGREGGMQGMFVTTMEGGGGSGRGGGVGRGGGRGGGGPVFVGGPMQMGEDAAGEMMNMLLSGLVGAGGFTDNVAEWIHGVLPNDGGGGMEGRETYEDWLGIIDRMGGNVNRSATEDEIEGLSRSVVQEQPANDEGSQRTGADKCAICLGPYEIGESVTTLTCGHRFHTQCVSQWLRLNRICPFCKQSIRTGERSVV